MKTPDEIYKRFTEKFPDVFLRRRMIRRWCIKCQRTLDLAKGVWRRMDLFEDCDAWENDSSLCDSDTCAKEEKRR